MGAAGENRGRGPRPLTRPPPWPRPAVGANPHSADDLAALLLALGLRHHGDTLALARVLAGAAVPGPGASAVPLALVDTGTLHLVATGLLLGTGLDGAGREQRRGSGGDQNALTGSSH